MFLEGSMRAARRICAPNDPTPLRVRIVNVVHMEARRTNPFRHALIALSEGVPTGWEAIVAHQSLKKKKKKPAHWASNETYLFLNKPRRALHTRVPTLNEQYKHSLNGLNLAPKTAQSLFS